MNGQDAVLGLEALVVKVSRDRAIGDDGRIARELIGTLAAERARFAPRSGHPVAMMLDEWIARLEAYAACPLLPMPD